MELIRNDIDTTNIGVTPFLDDPKKCNQLQNDSEWFALRATYSQELKVKDLLTNLGVESFIPMKYVEKMVDNKLKRVLAPAIHNLIFVFTNKANLQRIKSETVLSSMIRYMIDKSTKQPITIPPSQMDAFRAVSEQFDEGILYVDPKELELKNGDLVRIKAGIWEGITGRFIRIKRGTRVVVELNGLIAVATASIPPYMIEKI